MKAFTLIEAIFVIIIIGILGAIGVQYIPNEIPLSDSEILKKIILTKKTNALGYRIYGKNDYTCLKLDKDYINNEAQKNDSVKYKFKSEIIVDGLENSDKLICFDYLGRPYDGEVDKKLTFILRKVVTITLRNKKEMNLTLYPVSGYVR